MRPVESARRKEDRGRILSNLKGIAEHLIESIAMFSGTPIVVVSAFVPEIVEYNIGHSIIGRAIFVGLDQAIRDIVSIIRS